VSNCGELRGKRQKKSGFEEGGYCGEEREVKLVKKELF